LPCCLGEQPGVDHLTGRTPMGNSVRLAGITLVCGSDSRCGNHLAACGAIPSQFHHWLAESIHDRVVFQKWRWTEIAVTLGLIFVVSLRKEWPMTFIAVRCPHCQSDQIVKRGKTARGTQRYLCQNTLCVRGSFLLDYCNRGCLPDVKQTIIDMSLNA